MREIFPFIGRYIPIDAPRGKDLIIEGWGGGNIESVRD